MTGQVRTTMNEPSPFVKIKLMNGGKLPVYKTKGASCCDCYARIDNKLNYVVIFPGERELIPLGFAMELPNGYEAVIRPRSGMMTQGIDEGIGTIDSDYRGEVHACIINNTPNKQKIKIHNGDRICQMKIQTTTQASFEIVNELNETERGKGGFGSTGVR